MISMFWTKALAALAFCTGVLWVCAWFHEKGVRPVGTLADFARKTSVAGLCALALWVAPFIQYGGMKGGVSTNGIQTGSQDGLRPEVGGETTGTESEGDGGADITPIASTNTARKLTAEDFARGFVMTRVGTGETFGFAAPVDATVCADWRAFGAATDWIYLAFEDWAFRLGTNEMDRLRVFSFGKVDPLVRGADGRIAAGNWFAPFMASLGVVPQANWSLVAGNGSAATPEAPAPSQFWHFVTPSNTLQLTWQNVLFERLANTPVSIQMEVWPTGKFTYRYDLSRLDVDEVENVAAGASFGGLEWVTNAIPTNITSLSFHVLSIEDATNPDRDGDGMHDGREHKYGFNPLVNNDDADVDADGTNDPGGLFQSFDDTSSHFSGEGKVAHVLILDGCVVGDYDRRDGFTDYDLSWVYRNRPLRHWINDDDDEGDINEGDGDVPGVQGLSWRGGTMHAAGMGKEPDYGNGHVDGKCDILDFTPVWMDMGFALQQLTTVFKGTRAGDYALTLSQPEGAVNVVWTSLTTNNVGQFLSMDVSGCGKNLGKALEDAETVQLTEEETKVPADLISAMLENRARGVFLFEGRVLEDGRYYGTKYITLRCYRKPYTPGEGKHLFELKLPVSTSPVEDMFRWIDERWVCGDTNGVPSRTGSPWNNPDGECDGRHFVFVHGYNVNVQSARGWAAEMFKRLWQSGSRAMFTAVDWYGNDSEIPGWVPKYGGVAPNYYANVEHAFATASRFVTDCATLPGRKTFLAHSLGNMLVSSAIKDHGLADYSKYYMLNAAVPMEAYDNEAYAAPMIDHDWRGVSNVVYSANWHRLFNEEDGRSSLTWKRRFNGIARAINCYSATEDTLGNATINEWLVGR